MAHIIEKIEKGKFKIEWENVPDSLIMLDFNPLMKVCQLDHRVGVIEHWQAKPVGLRRWGLYCLMTDQYYSVDANKIDFAGVSRITSLQIPERDYPNIRPTAVKYYDRAYVKKVTEDSYVVIGK